MKMEENCKTNYRPKTFKEMIRSAWFWKPASALIIGGTAGFLYYYFVGCASGTCGITSNPYTSIIFGAAMGLFVVNRPCKTC
jgi:hypothetical protein